MEIDIQVGGHGGISLRFIRDRSQAVWSQCRGNAEGMRSECGVNAE